MSKQHVSHTPSSVLNDVRTLSTEELVNLYGIEISMDDGTVFDPTENRRFDNLTEWAIYVVEQDDENNYGSFDKFGGKFGFIED